ncbi:hypothetical protein DFQ01_105105 [Paenibacillus cellulosilyticus]|uniref:Amidase n=1 Tax=Paenibacillus cellulosilyticus TaxID=375489 RepID=A0A2V2YVW2_9BACL|nr:hypothetical protein [Paenibacillus cellulosilyticus]PWW05121.1 hypothetical protein DFQ01_105105 [Paenibacillus cellulosilyticus]QKS48670.1 hypothetical protein HUB94_31190 [Paenibacillus cellulosilyticus]
MRKFITILTLAFICCTIFPVAAQAKQKTTYMDQTNITTWLWDAAKIKTQPEQIIRNLTDRKVDTLLLQVDAAVNTQAYRTFIGLAHASGIQVHALDGAPQWAAAGGEALQDTFLNWLTAYQSAASATEKFDGIHLDVEPYDLDNYESEQNQILTAYQTMMVRFEKQSAQAGLTFGIDIPFWFYGVLYDNQYGKGNIAEWLCQHVKNIAIMAYRDTAEGADGIISIAAKEMKLFQTYGVKGTIAVETGRLSAANDFVTFYEESKAYMDGQLQTVYQQYQSHPAFAGIAIHYYDSWIQMK